MITVGIDIGSLATKAVALKGDGKILGQEIRLTGGDNRKTADLIYQDILTRNNLSRNNIDYVLTTGYGRENVKFSNGHATEITCHAKGLNYLYSDARMILDIGGQDSKAIHMEKNGTVADFIMNDKCSAGTGRFLEVIANALGVKLQDLGSLSAQSTQSIRVSSMCTVFAESEVVSQVAHGSPITDIIRGVHEAIAERSVTLLKRIGVREPIAMTGGVANNIGVVTEIENRLDKKLIIPEFPQAIGAIGAAVIAQQRIYQQTG